MIINCGGCQVVTTHALVCPAAADDYSALIEAGRHAILQTLVAAGIGKLQPHIQHEEVISPPQVCSCACFW